MMDTTTNEAIFNSSLSFLVQLSESEEGETYLANRAFPEGEPE